MSTTITARDPVAERIAELTARYERDVARVRSHAPALMTVMPICAKHPIVEDRPGVVCFEHGIVIYIRIETISQVTALLRDLADAGCRMTGRKDTSQEGGAGLVEWSFALLGDVVCVYAPLPGTSCKFVQTGHRTVPVFEVRCGEPAAEVAP